MNVQRSRVPIKIGFLGDVLIGGEFMPYAAKQNIDLHHPFRKIADFLTDVDILLVNLEGPVFEGSQRRTNVSSLLSNHPAILDLFSSKLRVFILANNHIMDYQQEGLEQTLHLLRGKGIPFVGAGRNRAEADKELIIECNGRKVGFLAFASKEPFVGAVVATDGAAGSASIEDIDAITMKIGRLKRLTDILCVSLHWGHEHFFYPSADQINIAHTLADAGVNIIVGHHPHVVQGMENYGDTVIAYSLGNLFLPAVRSTAGRLEPRKTITKEFMVLKATIGGATRSEVEMLGGRMEKNYTLNPYDKEGQRKFTAKIQGLSAPFYDKGYSNFWQNYKLRREKELERESLLEAVKKLLNTPLNDLAQTITIDDVKRNILRLSKVISKAFRFKQTKGNMS